MELKSGYKQTEIGPVPEDWQVSTIGELGEPVNGLTYSPTDVRKYGTLVLRASNIQNGKLSLEDNVYVDMDLPSRVIVQDGDLLICVRNGSKQLIGKCILLDHRVKGSVFGAFMSVVRSDNSNFIYRQFQSDIIQRQIAEVMGATINQLTNKNLKEFLIPFPPDIEEREAIVEALSHADNLIESIEVLIAKKRQIKQGAMDWLLTGKKRVPGFTDKWESKQLDDFGTFLKGAGVTKSQASTGDLPCVRYGEIYTRHNNFVNEFYSWISPDVAMTATRLQFGDILFAGSGETKEDIGKCVAFLHDVEAYAGGDIILFRLNRKADPLFFGYYLNTAFIAQQKANKGQGDAVVHISATSLAAIASKFPQVREQRAIATILFEMDDEIAALTTKLAKTRQIKQGMMQELLTGKIRLVQPASNVLPFAAKEKAVTTSNKGHNSAINEAVVISVLAKNFGSDQWPLGRKRYTKLSYLLHRHAEGGAEGYLKKAAGPYNPSTKYKGAEKIALTNRYVRSHARDNFSGFVAAEKIAEAEGYFSKWYGDNTIGWLEQFRYKKNDELELLATVDMAMVGLRDAGIQVDTASVKQYIHDAPEWTVKLNRPIFSDDNIVEAIEWSKQLFGS